MNTESQYTYPTYNHDLLNADTARYMSRVVYSSLHGLHFTPELFADQFAVWEKMSDQVNAINSFNVWYRALKTAGFNHDIPTITELANGNNHDMNELAYITSSGIVFGYDSIRRRVEQEEKTPIQEAALASVQTFDKPFAGIHEFADRTATVFGNLQERGKLNEILANVDKPFFKGQQIMEDILRIYGERTYTDLSVFTS